MVLTISHETIRRVLKKRTQAVAEALVVCAESEWGFVGAMEEERESYALPHDPAHLPRRSE